MSTTINTTSPVRMRLTRRGRVALAVLASLIGLGVAAVAGQAFAAAPADSDPAAAAASYASVYVAPGDSLWSIASPLAGERDVRDVIAEISSLNGLTSSVIQAGQELIVPLPASAQP